jgi:multimeric flavodoxin WrbA
MTTAIAINGSPRMAKGNTAMILGPFLEGMEEAGASVETLYAKRIRAKDCNGCFKCWDETIGRCYIKDGMPEVYPQLRPADILVLATPVYIPLPGAMQNFINRLLPLIEPVLETREGRTRARYHEDVSIRKIVLVASSGWWERGNIDTVLRIAQELAEHASVEFSGALLRPHAGLMRRKEKEAAEITGAARSAGRQLVTEDRISQETLVTISQPLISEDEYRRRSNYGYEEAKSR